MYFLFDLYGELKASDFISVASETLMTLKPFCFKLRIMFLPIANLSGSYFGCESEEASSLYTTNEYFVYKTIG